MQFSTIKRHNGKVHLSWELTSHGQNDIAQATLTSEDEPLSEFIEALDAFKDDVLCLLELPKKYEDGLEVTKLAINREADDGRIGLVITAVKSLGCGSLVLNTPHLRERTEEGDPGEGHLTSVQFDRIHAIEEAAERFVNGQRQQVDMFDHDEAA